MKLLINELVVNGDIQDIVKAVDEYVPTTRYICLTLSSTMGEPFTQTITKPDWKEEKDKFLNQVIQQILEKEENSAVITKSFS